MANKQLPSPDILRQLLRYEPETGKLFWKERTIEHVASDAQMRRWNTMFAGREALTANRSKDEVYKVGRVMGQIVLAHRVAWSIFYGETPSQMIDHKDGNPSNNRIENLTLSSTSQNARNCKRRVTNKSGTTGVFQETGRSGWTAVICVHKKITRLGRFSTYEDAVAARKKAEPLYGFSPNHDRAAT